MEERFTPQFRAASKNKVIKFIKSGTSLSILGMPGLGKTDFLNYVTQECDSKKCGVSCFYLSIQDILSVTELDFYRHLLLVLIEELNHLGNDDSDIIKEIEKAEKLMESSSSLLVFSEAKRLMKLYLEHTKNNVGIFIDGISKLKELKTSFFNSLRALRSVDKFRLAYIFVDDIDLARVFSREKADELYDLITNNIIWLPLPSEEEGRKIISNCERLFDCKLNQKQKDYIWKNAQGHASLTKYLTLYFCEDSSRSSDLADVVKNRAVKARIEKVLVTLSAEELEILRRIASGENETRDFIDVEETLDELFNFKVIYKTKDNKIKLFSNIVEAYLKKKRARVKTPIKKRTKLDSVKKIQIQNGEVFVEGRKIESDLTKTEFEILSFLIKKPNTIISRDEIADIMWKDQVGEKYSDWAIDRAISRLRKKLGDNAYRPQYLKTLRGRGFKLIN